MQIDFGKLQLHFAALDAAHFQHVIDKREKVLARRLDLLKVLPHILRAVALALGEVGVADDRIHGGANVVAHIEQEGAFRAVGRARLFQRLLQRPLLLRKLFLHLFLFGNVHEQSDVGDRGAVLTAGRATGLMKPAPSPVLCHKAVFHVIGALAGVIPQRIIIRFKDALAVLLMEQVRPRFQRIRKVLLIFIAQHFAELIAPCHGAHFSRLVKIHAPHTGLQHLMYDVEAGTLPLHKLQSLYALADKLLPFLPLFIHGVVGVFQVL